jgi:hypothetical protein
MSVRDFAAAQKLPASTMYQQFWNCGWQFTLTYLLEITFNAMVEPLIGNGGGLDDRPARDE